MESDHGEVRPDAEQLSERYELDKLVFCPHEGCGGKFVDQFDLNLHLKKPHSPCEFCGRNMTAAGLAQHKSWQHEGSGTRDLRARRIARGLQRRHERAKNARTKEGDKDGS